MARNTSLLPVLFIATLFTVALITGCTKPNDTNTEIPPVACINTLPDTINLGESISVNASCSQGATSYLWNFDDGTTATTSTASHTYGAGGSYTVSLTVTNAKGTNTTTKTVVVKITSAQYVGSFQVTEACGISSGPSYTSTIAASGSGQILINNFGNFITPINIVANVDNTTFTLVPQTTGGITITSGVGTIDPTLQYVNISYNYTDGTNTDDCVMQMIKQ